MATQVWKVGLAAALLCGLAGAVLATEAEKVWPTLPVGATPADELGKDLDGKQVRISDYHGKVVILSFWASWCGQCRKELPVLAGVVKKVGLDHLKVIAINFQDETKPFRYVVNVLKDYPITILRDSKGKTAKTFDVRAIPRMIIIDRDGKVVADHTGYGEGSIPELVEELNAALLAQPVVAKGT